MVIYSLKITECILFVIGPIMTKVNNQDKFLRVRGFHFNEENHTSADIKNKQIIKCKNMLIYIH